MTVDEGIALGIAIVMGSTIAVVVISMVIAKYLNRGDA
jgi:hypothetical protein